ncbi:uncharacterized protein [Typha latifolia]|uniref:uncharacterized protein isoform X1 n=1 Tax=Typha latifolia TaxID=4733 RepID=UPI003C2CDD11
MPPESSPWDRRDFASRDRRHDVLGNRSVGGYSTPRWRESYYGPRGFPRDSPRRHPSGYYRQGGGYHQPYPEDSGAYGCPPSRSDGLWVKDENFKPSGSYGGRCINRESRESFRRSPYRDSSSEFSKHQQKHYSPNALRSVAVQISPASQTALKDRNSTNDIAIDGSGTGRAVDRDLSSASILWRPSKWNCAIADRSGPEEAGLKESEAPDKESLIQSTVAYPQMPDEGSSKKKPRLGWGQGLAKYEKQKVQGSPDSYGVDVEDTLVQASSRVDGSPTSLTSGMEEKWGTRPITTIDACAPKLGVHIYSEFSMKLDQLEVNHISSLASFLDDLLQNEDVFFGDSGLIAAMNKLLLLKGDISKELEKTEFEIDWFESEFKSLDCDAENNDDLYSPPLPVNNESNPCLQSSDVEKVYTMSQYHELAPTVAHLTEAVFPASNCEEQDAQVKDMETDSKGIVSANCEKAAFLEVGVCNFNQGKLTKICNFNQGNLIECSVAIDNDSLNVPEAQQCLLDNAQERLATMSCHDNVKCVETGRNSACSIKACSYGKTNCNLISLIVTSNRDAAKRASQVFNISLPSNLPQFDFWRSGNISCHRKNDLKVKEKLSIRKHQLLFKERVLILKFRALHHLWKEDLQLLSIRKNRRKSKKRIELSRSQGDFQKQHSSIQFRLALPAGNQTLVPSQKLVGFVSKLPLGSQMKPYRSNIKMPALILDDIERRYTRFTTYNGLVEDPLSFEKERATINPWTREEIEVFKVMLVKFGKDFSRISCTLDHKTVADCVEFYYKNHKLEDFRGVKKRLDVRKQWQHSPASTYLVTSGKKWNPETNAASLDILGAASVIAEKSDYNVRSQQKVAARYQTYHDLKSFYNDCYDSVNRAQMVEVTAHEREYLTASVSAGICRALSSEAMSSCVTSSIDPGEKMSYVSLDRPFSPELTQNVYEEDTCSDEGCNELAFIDWTDEEKSVFIRALSMYGKNFARISHFVGTRSLEQCKIFFMKARKSLGLEVIDRATPKIGMPMTDDNEGSCDTDDACAAEIHSAICSDQCYSRVNPDFQSLAKASREGFIHAGVSPQQAEIDRLSEQDVLRGINLEANDSKFDKQVHAIYDYKLVNGADNSRSAVCSHVPIQLPEVAENIDKERKSGGSCVLVPQTEQAITESVPVGSILHTADGVQKNDGAGVHSIDGFKKVVSSHELMLPKSGSRKRRRASIDLGANSRDPLSLTADWGASDNYLHHGNVVDVCSRPSTFTTFQHKIPLYDLPCQHKEYHSISAYQDNCQPAQFNSSFHDRPICSVGNLHVASQTALNFEEHENKQHQNLVVGSPYQQYMLKSSLNQVAMRNGVSQSNQFISKMQNDNLNSCSLSPSSPGKVFLSTSNNEKSESQLVPCTQYANPETKRQSHQTGDVKLFGKVLNPSSSQRSSSSSQESTSPKPNESSTTTSSIRKDGDLFPYQLGSNCRLVLEEAPISYGFWDGNRIQTGFSSLSEYALMLAKHQGISPGVSSYSGKDGVLGNTAVLADYRQPFMHGKQLENFTELQKRNWVEIESVFQNSGRAALLGTSMVSGGGLLAGGVSDPVAALKLNYGSRNKNASCEVESCSGDTQEAGRIKN